MGVAELGRMMGTDPNLALSVLEGLGRWQAGRNAGGMDPQRKGWGRLQGRAGETSSSSSSTSNSSGGRTPPPQGPQPPPPKAPKKNPRHSESSEEDAPLPQAQQSKPQAKAKPQGKGKAKATPPPNPKPPLCKIGAGTPMGICQVWGTPGMSLGRRGAMGGPSAK